MIDRGGELSVKRQAELLDLSRANVYYRPRPVSERDLKLMRRIDELHLEAPFYGARKIAAQLQREGHEVGRKHVTTLMRRMGIEALYRKPRTSIPARGATIYPYLLENLVIDRPNQVWSSDLTYLPMAHGFLYLMAILDVASRKVLAWRLSNTLTAHFCVEALEEAMRKYGRPEIFNTDQGSQFTSEDWIAPLKAAGVAISMDGKGRWIDNVFIERLWRSVKYEEVYLRAYANGTKRARRCKSISASTMNGAFTRISTTRRRTRCISVSSQRRHGRQREGHDPQIPRHLDFRGYRDSGCLEISAPGAFTAAGFFRPKNKPGASAAERGRLREFKTIDEERR